MPGACGKRQMQKGLMRPQALQQTPFLSQRSWSSPHPSHRTATAPQGDGLSRAPHKVQRDGGGSEGQRIKLVKLASAVAVTYCYSSK